MAKRDEQELSLDEKFQLVLELLASRPATSGGLTKDDLAEILQSNAQAFRKAMKPENEHHPGKSAFSHPDGEQAKPKEPLPFELFYNGYPIHKFPETESWREWELARQLQPGEYTVIRRDGSVMAVAVKGERDAVGRLTKLVIEHPILREEKNLVPPKTVLFYQLLHNENPRKAFVEAMQEHFAAMLPEAVGAV